MIFCNRCGVEDDVHYAGTSAVLGVKGGEVLVYGLLGRGVKELLVVDTTQPAFAKLIHRPESDFQVPGAQSPTSSTRSLDGRSEHESPKATSPPRQPGTVRFEEGTKDSSEKPKDAEKSLPPIDTAQVSGKRERPSPKIQIPPPPPKHSRQGSVPPTIIDESPTTIPTPTMPSPTPLAVRPKITIPSQTRPSKEHASTPYPHDRYSGRPGDSARTPKVYGGRVDISHEQMTPYSARERDNEKSKYFWVPSQTLLQTPIEPAWSPLSPGASASVLKFPSVAGGWRDAPEKSERRPKPEAEKPATSARAGPRSRDAQPRVASKTQDPSTGDLKPPVLPQEKRSTSATRSERSSRSARTAKSDESAKSNRSKRSTSSAPEPPPKDDPEIPPSNVDRPSSPKSRNASRNASRNVSRSRHQRRPSEPYANPEHSDIAARLAALNRPASAMGSGAVLHEAEPDRPRSPKSRNASKTRPMEALDRPQPDRVMNLSHAASIPIAASPSIFETDRPASHRPGSRTGRRTASESSRQARPASRAHSRSASQSGDPNRKKCTCSVRNASPLGAPKVRGPPSFAPPGPPVDHIAHHMAPARPESRTGRVSSVSQGQGPRPSSRAASRGRARTGENESGAPQDEEVNPPGAVREFFRSTSRAARQDDEIIAIVEISSSGCEVHGPGAFPPEGVAPDELVAGEQRSSPLCRVHGTPSTDADKASTSPVAVHSCCLHGKRRSSDSVHDCGSAIPSPPDSARTVGPLVPARPAPPPPPPPPMSSCPTMDGSSVLTAETPRSPITVTAAWQDARTPLPMLIPRDKTGTPNLFSAVSVPTPTPEEQAVRVATPETRIEHLQAEVDRPKSAVW